MSLECEHGQLARSCNICEYEREIAELTARVGELEAENKRLQMINPCNHTGFESAPCDICGYPDPRKLIARLKDERDADRRREYGYSQQTVDALTLERDKLTKRVAELEAENKRLRELVDGARVIVEVFQWSTPAQERWREEWLKKAAKALGEASHESK